MDSNARNRPAYRLRRLLALPLGIGALVLAAAPVVVNAASRSRVTTQAPQTIGRTAKSASSSICSKVSAAAVSAIVGYRVPAATTTTLHEKPTAQNFGISGVTTLCVFGAQTSLAADKKAVNLTFEITSRALTAQEVKTELAKLKSATLKITVASYSGLGVPAFLFTETAAGLRAASIVGLAGKTYFGATVLQPLPVSKLASLAKLARTL
jgi:hypothetical protein